MSINLGGNCRAQSLAAISTKNIKATITAMVSMIASQPPIGQRGRGRGARGGRTRIAIQRERPTGIRCAAAKTAVKTIAGPKIRCVTSFLVLMPLRFAKRAELSENDQVGKEQRAASARAAETAYGRQGAKLRLGS